MSVVLKKPAAESHLIDIWLYIAEDNPAAADGVLDSIEETCKLLIRNPEIGKVFKSYKVKLKDIRYFPVKSFPKYIVYYKTFESGIEVIRVLHAAMRKEKRLNV